MSNEVNELKNALKTAETRVNVLESELAKKTEVLENTEKLLENSQQQYKEMLMRISEMSQQKQGGDDQETEELRKQVQISNAQIENQTNMISQQRGEIETLQIENEKLKKSLRFHSERDFYTGKQNCQNSGEKVQKTVYQLREAQEDVLDLKAENENLKLQISKLRKEEKEWSECASNVFEELTSTFKLSKLFPRSDSVMQRSCLLDLVKELANNEKYNFSAKTRANTKTHQYEREETERERYRANRRVCGHVDDYPEYCDYDSSDYRQKYIRAKQSLGRVTEKCDHMLDMMDGTNYRRYNYCAEPLYQGYNSRDYMYSSPPERYERRRNFEQYRNEETYQSDKGFNFTSKPTKKENKYSNTTLKAHRKELGDCVKELHGITKQIKSDYQEMFQ